MEFYLRHVYYTKIQADTVDEAIDISKELQHEIRHAINDPIPTGRMVFDSDREKDWELYSQVKFQNRQNGSKL
jgi:hypothetical protein